MSETTQRLRGFAIGNNASRFARKAHAMGPEYCREWSRAEAAEAARKAAELRTQRAREAREVRILRQRLKWRLQRLGLPER